MYFLKVRLTWLASWVPGNRIYNYISECLIPKVWSLGHNTKWDLKVRTQEGYEGLSITEGRSSRSWREPWEREHRPQDLSELLRNEDFPNCGERASTAHSGSRHVHFPAPPFRVISVNRQPLWLEQEWEGFREGCFGVFEVNTSTCWKGGHYLFGLTCSSYSAKPARRTYYSLSSCHSESKHRGWKPRSPLAEVYWPLLSAIRPACLEWPDLNIPEGSPYVFRRHMVTGITSCDISRR